MAEEDEEMFAAEYVLGTLDALERDEAQQRLIGNLAFATMVRRWEKRLGALHQMVAPVEPAPELWTRVLSRATGTPQDEIRLPDSLRPPDPDLRLSARNLQLAQEARRWKGVAALCAGAALLLALFAAVREFMPSFLPEALRPAPRIVTVTAPPPPAPVRAPAFVAVLQETPSAAAFILTVDMDARSFTARRVGAPAPADKNYELWLVHSQYPGPRSLGVIGDDVFTTRAALASYDRAVIEGATYSVSVEPVGGAPEGTPTGPIVFSGNLVEAASGKP
ncbi:MAG: anti-sigma factor [Pseudorhodoplanes sp.]